ncbi:MAG: TRAP transporter substrate-binding protein [Deltaproteobacteria bacterium]|nr:TRAP transporter substrate-binding protein [Deltaproteobacteria bacterium]
MKGLKLLIGLTLVLPLVSLSLAAEKTTLKFAHNYPLGHPHYEGAELFKKLVEQRSGGQLEVQVFPNNQLGNDRQIFEAMKLGSIDLILTDQGVPSYAGQPIWPILQSPYMYRDYDHAFKVFHAPLLQQLYDRCEREISVTVLDPMWYYGIRHLTTAKKLVRTPADLKGMKIRAPTIPVFIKAVEFMGGNAVPISFPDLYLALKQGVVDGQENPVATIFANKYYETQKYLILTGHILSKNAAFMNTDRLKKLPANHQQVIKQAMTEAGRHNDKLMLDSEQSIQKKLVELGMQIVEPEVQAFREAAYNGVKSWLKPEEYDFYGKAQNIK